MKVILYTLALLALAACSVSQEHYIEDGTCWSRERTRIFGVKVFDVEADVEEGCGR